MLIRVNRNLTTNIIKREANKLIRRVVKDRTGFRIILPHLINRNTVVNEQLISYANTFL